MMTTAGIYFATMDECRNYVVQALGEFASEFNRDMLDMICVNCFTWNEYYKVYDIAVEEAEFWDIVRYVNEYSVVN